MLAYKCTQILFEPNQHTELTNIAAEEKRSLSDIVRETMSRYLAERAARKKREKALAAIERLTTFRKKLVERTTEPLPEPADILNEMREERMADMERALRGEE